MSNAIIPRENKKKRYPLLSSDYFIKLGEPGFLFQDYELWYESARTLGEISKVVDESMNTNYCIASDLFDEFESHRRKYAYIMRKTGWFVWAGNKVYIVRDETLDKTNEKTDFEFITYEKYQVKKNKKGTFYLTLHGQGSYKTNAFIELSDMPFVTAALKILDKHLETQKRPAFSISSSLQSSA